MDSTLQEMRITVRKITKSPSSSQLSDEEINRNINKVLQYDLVQEIALVSQTKTLTFYTRPYVDVYSTVDAPQGDPLYDFKNKYNGISMPVYINGEDASYTQRRESFYSYYPKYNEIKTVATGNGATNQYTGSANKYNAPVLQRNVLFSAYSINEYEMQLIDYPINDRQGNLVLTTNQNPPNTLQANNFINYETGEFVVTFPDPVKDQKEVRYTFVSYKPSKPYSVLFFDNSFTLRPVPDKSYPVNIQVYKQPMKMIEDDDEPELRLWSQYIAYKASSKIFVDRMDMENAAKIQPFIDEQESFILSRISRFYSNQRAPTIYQESIEGDGFSTRSNMNNDYF